MKNKKSIIAVVAIVLVGSLGFYGYTNYFQVSAEEVVAETQTYEVSITSLSETYSTSGNVSSKVDKTITAPFDSDSFTSAVSEGDVVAAGDIIATFDDSDIRVDVLTQEKTVLSLEAELAELKSNGNSSYSVSLQNSKIEYLDAKETYDDNVKLFASGALSQSDLDESKDAMDKALNSYNLDQNQYSGYDINSQLEILEKSLEIEQLILEDLYAEAEQVVLRADCAGTVVEFYIEDGDSVSTGDSIYRIMDMTSLEIITDVSEYEIKDLELGQTVFIQSLGDDSLVGMGEIVFIDPNAEIDGTDVVIAITIDINKGAENFKPGYSTDLTVMVAQSDSAMVVPYDALISAQNTYMVTKIVDGEEVKVIVETGIESDLMVEIISDEILEGDEVIVYSAIDYSNEAASGGMMIPGMGGGGGGGGQRPDGAVKNN